MDVQQLKERKLRMEENIKNSIVKELEQFTLDTGFSIKDLIIETENVNPLIIRDESKLFITKVHCIVNL